MAMAPAEAALRQAVHVVFGEWTCLALAVEQEWGGSNTREKALALLSRVEAGLCASPKVYVDEIEEMLDLALIDDFNIHAEDESPKQVATLLVQLHTEAVAGGEAMASTLIDRFRTAGKSTWVQAAPPPRRRKDDSSDDEDCGSDGEDVPPGGAMETVVEETEEERAARLAPVVDEDGFQAVPTRRGRR